VALQSRRVRPREHEVFLESCPKCQNPQALTPHTVACRNLQSERQVAM
jgi:hypothetical protein